MGEEKESKKEKRRGEVLVILYFTYLLTHLWFGLSCHLFFLGWDGIVRWMVTGVRIGKIKEEAGRFYFFD